MEGCDLSALEGRRVRSSNSSVALSTGFSVAQKSSAIARNSLSHIFLQLSCRLSAFKLAVLARGMDFATGRRKFNGEILC
jgi:hypothetical protein